MDRKKTFANRTDKVAIPIIDRILFVWCSDIVCFDYDGKYWNMYDNDGVCHRLLSSIKSETILSYSETFINITQSQILNTDFLLSVENKTLKCELSADKYRHDLYFSRTYYKKFCEQFLQDTQTV